MQEHNIYTNYKARYFTLGKLDKTTEQLWVVCHGYGQLARRFINKFQALDNGKNYIIAPEGLSRFYIEGFSGKTGATWMTREDRLTDIENYINFLDAVYKEAVAEIDLQQVKITILGFSQGAATVSRWVTQSQVHFDRLILWAGIYPPDLDFDKGKERIFDKKTFLVHGEQDPYLNEQRLKEQETLARKLGDPPRIITFSGKHQIDEETLRQFDEF